MKTYSCIRLCAVALLLLGTSVSLSHAQNDSNRTHDVHNDYLTRIDYKLGLVGGVNFAGAQTLPSPFKNVTAEGATGYVFGIHADMNLVPLFSVQAELLITQRNFQLPSGSSENWSERLTYFQLPLLLKFTPIPGPIQPYVYLGPDIEVRFSAEFNSSVVNGVTNNNVFNSIDVSLDAGLGIQFQVGTKIWLFAEGRYSHGLTSIYNSGQSDASLGDLRARDTKLLVGVMFGF